jgi:hypothetical protein
MLRDLIDPEMYLTWREWRYARYVEKLRGRRALERFQAGSPGPRNAPAPVALRYADQWAVSRRYTPPDTTHLSNRLLEIALADARELSQK